MTSGLSFPHGWINAEWQKLPFLFGVSDTRIDQLVIDPTVAGANTLDSDPVPEGRIWVITNVAIRDSTAAVNVIYAQLNDGSNISTLFAQVSPTATVYYDRQTWAVLKEGDMIRLRLDGATVGKAADLRYSGFVMSINE